MAKAASEQKYLTLILGAGASMPYGFPSGAVLVSDIIKEAKKYTLTSLDSNQGGIGEKLPPIRQDYDIIKNHFRNSINLYPDLDDSVLSKVSETIVNQLTLYQPTSIDSYLGNLYNAQDDESKIHADLCKYYICKCIAEHYDLKKFRIPAADNLPAGVENLADEAKKRPKWLQHLFNAIFYYLHKRDYKVEQLPIKIITFNYDTLLEQHFFDWVEKNNFLTAEMKKKVVQLFCESIRHIYGQIGFLAQQQKPKYGQIPEREFLHGPDESSEKEAVPFDSNLNAEQRRRAIRDMALRSINRIGLINYGAGDDKTTNRANQDDIKKAQEWLTRTNTLIISGYYFDDENNQQLNLDEASKAIPYIHCTVYDAGFSLIDGVKQNFRLFKQNDLRDIWVNGDYIEPKRRQDNFLKIYNSTTLEMLSKEINLVKLTSNLK